MSTVRISSCSHSDVEASNATQRATMYVTFIESDFLDNYSDAWKLLLFYVEGNHMPGLP